MLIPMNKKILRMAFLKTDQGVTYSITQYIDGTIKLHEQYEGSQDWNELKTSPLLNTFFKLFQWFKAVENIEGQKYFKILKI